MSKEKVYGVVRTGGNKKAIVYRAESYDMLDLPEGFMNKREAKGIAKSCNKAFGFAGFTYTVFKIKFKETI